MLDNWDWISFFVGVVGTVLFGGGAMLLVWILGEDGWEGDA